MKHITLRVLALVTITTILALAFILWAVSDALAQGYENVCTCYRFPSCWFIAEYTRDGQPGDGAWEWLPLWSEMLRYQVRTFGAGWSCRHGMGR